MRMMLVPPVVLMLVYERYFVALLLLMAAGLSDALDGYLAKRFGWGSRLGSILDPLADKLLLMSSYIALGWLGQIPVWLVLVVVGRDIIIVAGGLAYHYGIKPIDLMAPTLLSKLNTLAQIILVLVVLLAESLLPLPDWMITGLVYIVLLTTLLSGLGYVWTWGARALHAKEVRSRD